MCSQFYRYRNTATFISEDEFRKETAKGTSERCAIENRAWRSVGR